MVRFKNRWLLVEFLPTLVPSVGSQEPANELTGRDIWTALRDSVVLQFGDAGWGAVGLSLTVKYFSPMTNLAIIRVSRDAHKIAWAATTLISSISERKYIPNVVHVSGTIKHAQLAAIEHNRIVVARYRARSKLPAAYHDSYDEFLRQSTNEIQALQD